MREPIALGAYYERDTQLLKEQIDAHYSGPRSPGKLPSGLGKNVAAIIAPNSPYKHCGDCMAHSYKALAETPRSDVYIIISANHHSQEAGISLQSFATPLGIVRVDMELGQLIVKQGTIPINEEIHARDHGIEVQLPFLQHAKYHEMEELRILPIIINDTIDIADLAKGILQAMQQLKRNAIIIASTDLTHYGPVFHFVPFTTEVQSRIYEIDDEMIQLIQRRDADGYAKFIAKTFETQEGLRTIDLLLRLTPSCAVRKMQHYTSGDIIGDYKNSVSYAAITFEKVYQ